MLNISMSGLPELTILEIKMVMSKLLYLVKDWSSYLYVEPLVVAQKSTEL